MNLNEPVTALKGIGGKSAEKFAQAGISTIGDLIGYYPVRYEKYDEPGMPGELTDGRIAAVCGFIEKQLTVKRSGRGQITAGKIISGEGAVQVMWFNMPYLRAGLKPGVMKVFRGRVSQKGRRIILLQPQVFDPEVYAEKTKALQPVYPLVKGLTENMLRKAISQALEMTGGGPDHLPDGIREKYKVSVLPFAIEQIHFPTSMHELVIARERLVFDEFLLFLMGIRRIRENTAAICHEYEMERSLFTEQAIRSLPFELTGAQKRVWADIEKEMTGRRVMTRLVQGDVGSGKTIVAFLALLMCAGNGRQGALMVPTEVLARQHYEAFCALTERSGINCRCVLLTGSMKAAEKREAYAMIASGEAVVIIGTHALVQEKLSFNNLSLVITDEQHRFGVRQRETLFGKGEMPHTLVMSATPIPRTLAVILFGDLEISVIDELPSNRLPIKNCVVGTGYRPSAYQFITGQVRAGHQAYVVCPMVDESEVVEAENVMEYSRKLSEALPEDITVGVLHGQMKSAQKNKIMESFLSGEIKVLVSTTVIEVGVDVPNATVMMIENAERFGLAQLHQLRGRVGRGSAQSYCIMICTDDKEDVRKRLEVMNRSNDGFEIAREDLKMRGPGDLFGIRQHGEVSFLLGDIYQDADVLQRAYTASGEILAKLHESTPPEYQLLTEKLTSYMDNGMKNLNI